MRKVHFSDNGGRVFLQLDFGETVLAGALDALFTAVLVVIAAGLVVRYFESRAAERRSQAEEEHQKFMQDREQEAEARASLRETYAQLLVKQRAAREAAIQLADSSSNSNLREAVIAAHGEFLDLYHRLALDADRQMWLDARTLRAILDKMRDLALEGDSKGCRQLVETARHARQNLERSFRQRLGHDVLQNRKDVGDYQRK